MAVLWNDNLKRGLEAMPYHKFLGLEILEAGDGRSLLRVPVTPNIQSPSGTVHAGVFYTFCDVSCFVALATVLEPGVLPVTVDLHTAVCGNVTGGFLDFRAKIRNVGRTIALIESECTGGETLVATARLTKYLKRPQEG